VTANQGASTTLSGAMHTFHASRMAEPGVPGNACQACHPGPQTQCLRGAMAKAGITCTNCHGTMSDVGDPARTPWVNLPACQSCHTANLVKAEVKTIDNPNQHLTPTDAALFRNSKAHGGGGIYCPACHGSPHAIYPSTLALDNQQSIRLQGTAGTIADCTVCHGRRPRESFFHFGGD
jgi:predicted outer membrane repeat protein